MARNLFVWSIVCSVGLYYLPEGEAGPLKRWKERRSGGGDTHNVAATPPPAPPMSPAPTNTMNCPPGGCPPQMQSVIQQVPQFMVQQPMAPVVRRAAPPVAERGVLTGREDARVDRLISALENRLGIKPQAAVTGDPRALLNKLPRVRIQLQTQEGATTDEVEIDLKMYLLEKMME